MSKSVERRKAIQNCETKNDIDLFAIINREVGVKEVEAMIKRHKQDIEVSAKKKNKKRRK